MPGQQHAFLPTRTPYPAQVGNAARGWLSQQEERAHFALWALLKSPLFVGADLRVLPPSSLAVLTSREVIAINQDPQGVAGDLIWKQGPKEVSRGLGWWQWEAFEQAAGCR